MIKFFIGFVFLLSVFSSSVFSDTKNTDATEKSAPVEVVLSDDEIMQKINLKIESNELKITKKLREIYTSQGEKRDLLGIQILELDKQIKNGIDSAVALLSDMQQEEVDVTAYVKTLHKHLNRRVKQLRKMYGFVINRVDELVGKSRTIELKERFKYEQSVNRGRVVISDILFYFQKNIEIKKQFKLDADRDIKIFSDLLLAVSDETASRLKLVTVKIDNKKSEISNSSDETNKKLIVELSALQEKRTGIVDGLSLMVSLMLKNNLDTTKLSQLLITSSGTINKQIFDKKVVLGLLSQWTNDFEKWLKINASSFVVNAVIIIFILLLFKLISSMTGRLLTRALNVSQIKISKLLQEFFVSSIRRLIMFVGVLISLSQVGVELGPLLAGLGVLGFVVGFALQGVLSNFASGLMILIYRPYDVGDVVEIAKVKGTVKEMSMVSTTMLSFNNERLVIPNNSIWGSIIRNITSESTRRVDLVFKVSFDADIELLDKIFSEEVARISAVLENPAPTIELHKQHETHLEFIVRPWVNKEDYWSTYWALLKSIQLRMNKEGVPKLNPYEFLKPLINSK